MVVVGGEEDGFVRQRGVAARARGYHVAGNKWPQAADDVRFELDVEGKGLEVAGLRLLEELVEIESRHADQFFRCIGADPRSGLQFRRAVQLQIRFFIAPGVANYLPRITGEIGAVNDQRGDRSATGGFFQFIGPAAVVGEGGALEKIWIVRDGLVYEEQRYFTF